MPIYRYRCQNCGIEFEIAQTFFDKPLARCLECRENTVQRVPQLPAIIFKGSGWYSTDHHSIHNQKTDSLNKKRSNKAECSTDEKNES